MQQFEPVKLLGQGGFGSVILAKEKVDESADGTSRLVAMKLVGGMTKRDIGYARREIDILKELDHRNIVKIIQSWEPRDQTCAAVMALSYAQGPTLETLLRYGGALSLHFARVVSAQLVSALAYLHSRAVIHRDIKPDNFIIVGASLTQDDIWDDQTTVPEWDALLKKWHVMLIYFGLARALTPNDMKQHHREGNAITPDICSSTSSSRNITGSIRGLSNSSSRRLTRQMSAVGNRTYAAPEVQQGVHFALHSHHSAIDVTRTLSDHVSRYGLVADAYSCGRTIKYMLTGVPPNQDVNQVLATLNNPVIILCRLICRRRNKDSGRMLKYRATSKIPKEVWRLILGMTNSNPQERTSVRTARQYPWIDDILNEEEEGETSTLTERINYLSFAKNGSANAPNSEK